MRSELAKSLPEDFDSTSPTVEQVIENRNSNRENFTHSSLPEAKRALVVGAGPSATPFLVECLGLYGTSCKYDAVLVTFPMAHHLRYRIIGTDNIYIVDGEFLETTTHFYGDLIERTWLICPWEKKLKPEWKFKATTFLMPEGEPNWEKRARLSPNYPKSTGAIALQVALEDMGGETIVDVIGIDCTDDYAVLKEETMRVIDRHRDRVNLINCGIGE